MKSTLIALRLDYEHKVMLQCIMAYHGWSKSESLRRCVNMLYANKINEE